MDIEDKVEKVSLESGNDGSPIGDFPQEATSDFMNELLPLRYVGFDEVYKKSKHETGIFYVCTFKMAHLFEWFIIQKRMLSQQVLLEQKRYNH